MPDRESMSESTGFQTHIRYFSSRRRTEQMLRDGIAGLEESLDDASKLIQWIHDHAGVPDAWLARAKDYLGIEE